MFKPDIYVEHVCDIDYSKLKANGIKLICFDVDNTLDRPDRITTNLEANVAKTLQVVNQLEFDVLLFSNNSIEERVSSFAKLTNYEYVAWARKPFQKNYKNHPKIQRYEKSEIVFVGDKVVTDIVGAKLFGSPAILVDPIYPKSKKWYSIIMKISENIFTKLIGFKRGKYYGA